MNRYRISTGGFALIVPSVLFLTAAFHVHLSPDDAPPHRSETKTFVAYSMRAAQDRAMQAIATGEDFRETAPQLYLLGGITKPWAIVFDSLEQDWILIGERDADSDVLTLDDWAVALKARFEYPDEDPGVTINPRGNLRSRSRVQDVVFFSGIDRTHFGQVCYEADWLMKLIGLGLEKVSVEGLQTYWDLTLNQNLKSNTKGIQSRFWFYPIISRVNVLQEAVVLERFQMGVFTEVMAARVEGKDISDVSQLEHYPAEEFARSFTEHYDEIASTKSGKVLKTLKGLTRLAGLAKGLQEASWAPDVNYWLHEYPILNVETLDTVEVVKNRDVRSGISVSGGVRLNALAMRLRAGDAAALQEIVLESKGDNRSQLVWEYGIQLQDGRPVGVNLPDRSSDPEDTIPLLSQAGFLQEMERYEEAVTLYDDILRLRPEPSIYVMRGKAKYLAKDYEGALADFRKGDDGGAESSSINFLRGLTRYALKEYHKALNEFDRALEQHADYSRIYAYRGLSKVELEDYGGALADFDKAIELGGDSPAIYYGRAEAKDNLKDPNGAISDYAIAYYRLSLSRMKEGEYHDAQVLLDKAIELKPDYAEAYYARGTTKYSLGDSYEAVADFDKAIGFRPNHTEAYYSRGNTNYRLGDFDDALANYDKAIELKPDYAEAYYARGNAKYRMDNFSGALADFDRAVDLKVDYAEVFNMRGFTKYRLGDLHGAIADYDKAIELKVNYVDAYNNRGMAKGKLGDRIGSKIDRAKALQLTI